MHFKPEITTLKRFNTSIQSGCSLLEKKVTPAMNVRELVREDETIDSLADQNYKLEQRITVQIKKKKKNYEISNTSQLLKDQLEVLI